MLKAGIVGMPNVGKSTLFNSLIKSHNAQAENYPFCTIEPNVGIVEVPDERLNVLSKISNSTKVIPTAIEVVDIAGLVKGASQGEGLGNKFLSHIREVDAIGHVVRCFEEENVHHVDGSVDPLRDIDVINTELMLADLESLEKKKGNLEKKVKGQDKEAKNLLEVCLKLLEHLNDGKTAYTCDLSDDERQISKQLFLLTNKPVIYVCNVSEDSLAEISSNGLETNKMVKDVSDFAKKNQGAETIIVSASLEQELLLLEDEDRNDYLENLGVKTSGLDQLIKAIYDTLGLRTYITSGEMETRAWTIKSGDEAPAAAGVIHTDFERGFIAAEVIAYEDMIECGSKSNAKTQGKLRLEGKNYTVQEGDIIEFRFNV